MPITDSSSFEKVVAGCEKQPESSMDTQPDTPKDDCKMEDVKQYERPSSPGNSKNPSSAPLFLFDWDDTLLASSFLRGKGYRLDAEFERTPEVEEGLRELEQSIYDVLNMAMQLGAVVVVTNAENGWVQLSAQKFVPAVCPLLSKLKIISARSTYEGSHPENPLKWKYCAFQENVLATFGAETKYVKHVVSFGDSNVEREAVRAVTRNITNCRTKSVKFAESPSLRELVRELQLVTNCMTYVVTHDGDLDLQLSITINA